MSVATSTAIGIAGAIGAAGSVGGALIGGSAAKSAANTQAQAADQAAQLQYQAEQNSLAEQQREFNIGQQNLAPWLQQGRSALANLSYLMGTLPGVPTLPSNAVPLPGDTGIPGTPGNPVVVPGGLGNPPHLIGANVQTPADGSVSNPVQMRMMARSQLMTPNSGGEIGGPVGENIFGSGQLNTASSADNGEGPIFPTDVGPHRGQDWALSDSGLQVVPDVAGPAGGFTAGSGVLQNNSLTGQATVTQPATADPTNLGQYVNPQLGAAGSLMQPWTQQFQAPTNVTEQNDPGYQFRLQQGQQALEHSAAARGNLLSGGTAQQENQLAQDYASNEYNNVYNRALQQYQQNYNIFQQNQANQFNRLAALSGVGQTTAGQLNSAGQQYANNVSNIELGTAANIGQLAQNAAAARGSGYLSSGAAWNNALGSLGQTAGGLANLYAMQQMMNPPTPVVTSTIDYSGQ